jgi:hypothetical protein
MVQAEFLSSDDFGSSISALACTLPLCPNPDLIATLALRIGIRRRAGTPIPLRFA